MNAWPPGPAGNPLGYPHRYERGLTLADGRPVRVRPILPADAGELREAFRTATPDTLRRRFLGPPPPVTPALLAHLTTVDYHRRMALVAFDTVTGAGIGIARYEPMEDGVAEIAVVVHPAWRRVGLATALIGMLAEAALDRGIHAFSAVYLAENLPVAGLLEMAGGSGRRLISQGIAEFEVELDRQRVAAATDRRRAADPAAVPDPAAVDPAAASDPAVSLEPAALPGPPAVPGPRPPAEADPARGAG